jgi:hypothetical protein
MNDNQIADVWLLFKEYIDKKDVGTLAEQYIDLLADYGIKDKALEGARGADADLDHAIDYYLEDDAGDYEEEEESYYEEDEE